jgi:DNA modification methylase
MATFYRGDCIEQMSKLPAKSIDFIYFNPPFGTTKQPWDSKLDWPKIFKECYGPAASYINVTNVNEVARTMNRLFMSKPQNS